MIIVTEGIDGSGKTTQSKRLAEELGAEWKAFPDRSTPFGRLIDGWLKGQWNVTLPDNRTGGESREANALVHHALQVANKAECFEWLERMRAETAVVLDRYWQSSYAYGVADGLAGPHQEAATAFLPLAAVNILIDIDVPVALERIERRAEGKTFYERQETLEKAASAYRELWVRKRAAHPNHWAIVDGRGTHDETYKQVLAATFLRPVELG